MIIAGVLLCLGSVAYFGLCAVNYAFRRTYVRPVFYAVEQGQDAYQAALVCAEDMAGGQMFVGGCFSGAVLVLGGVVTVLAMRQTK
jgi:hypothetical protein